MLRLLLETTTEVCSVAVAREGTILAEVTAREVQQHASHLTGFIQQALEEAAVSLSDLEGILISDGPGSYTSLRVGAATAKGLCVATPGLRLYAVPTLEAIARAAVPDGADKILATINSRRGEVFGRVFSARDHSPLTEVMNVRLTDPQWRGKLLGGRALGRLLVVGPGQTRVREALDDDNAFSFGPPDTVAARNLLAPAPRRQDVAAYEPLYLNQPFVTRPKKKSLL
ncbi:tRNA (adenosine(37)-N6)-threonylcarbamoyltransferase complex dimerization subunit type 1 TsaB [Lewinella sp. JB7]|uniref:tRNA (adenosine(37)-N6)-threonylcarbamoyltransferase complex dimerization subunit type 1 TsaB n=1 Tax=Lewinella sp. JB7 TaxID=2962887 RepID=UPI0020CA1071|nr:tRNA (adenosine(37)-N6)-threonylcarbamoyltransferase complex dimerization subunit type 1 TsaB [Lewinella sp. JB7]MCP9237868.1 tRNA (adenosine(37)-N6)-threonylcarbamoyltransferase complex dimerization subunit type 1 TsaB [Lewinella sp. JB7]